MLPSHRCTLSPAWSCSPSPDPLPCAPLAELGWGAEGPGKGGPYRGQLWGGEELLELLELLLLLLQEVSLLLR